jgi:hypothetical protein
MMMTMIPLAFFPHCIASDLAFLEGCSFSGLGMGTTDSAMARSMARRCMYISVARQ